MGLFGKTKNDPKDKVKEMISNLKKEINHLDRWVKRIEREEGKVIKSLQEAAKQNDNETCKLLAKEIVRSRKTIKNIHSSKAHMNSVMMGLNYQLANLRAAKSIEKSSEVLRNIQYLLNVPEVCKTMQSFAVEMMKAGIIEEMTEEVFEDLEHNDDLDEEVEQEIEKVLWELTDGQLGNVPAIVSELIPSIEIENSPNSNSVKEPNDFSDMQEKLEELRN